MNNKLNSNEYVKTTEQTLTEEQKEQVRENIGVGSSNVIDNVNSTSTTESLSANQGRILNEKIDSSVSVLNDTITQNVNELQQEIDANGGDIAGLQGDVSELNQTMQRTLKTPLATPFDSVVVGIDDNGDQMNLNVGNGLYIANGMIGAEHPVGSYYFCRNGSNNPASIFGGTWTKVAENVVLSLDNTAPVIPDEIIDSSLFKGVGVRMGNPNGTLNANQYSLLSDNGYLMGQSSSSGAAKSALVPINLHANFNNTIDSVDIWLREA